MPVVVTTIAELRERIAAERRAALQDGPADAPVGRVVLVPTMGALHDGHLRLVSQARDLGGFVVVSVFVNPLQFGPAEDLDRYPRTLDHDVAALEGLADVVFAPSASEMYPNGEPATRITAGEAGTRFEGASRPGHFDGVLTVVAKLFNIVQPDVAVFGQKDAQQVHVIGRMVDDLDLPITIAVVETVREADGLALSSRNRYLEGDDRRAAVVLSQALAAGAAAAGDGVEAVLAAAWERIDDEPAVRLDYLVIVDPASFREVAPGYRGPALLLVAARVGSTRLIDNERLTIA
ncbi:pantoate--beta-alanine ligase [Leifsonia sp. AG29]|uniref:pantoate--beta-alanine ligase n=1 Tax=Leifsonia sp. AG29 TaxID=2598860 RepID=UPI00131D52B3|nr:pantoate--beta-alanine ligase [Leifsonia sp. AG29]